MDGVFIVIIYLSLSFTQPSPAFSRCVLMRAGSADGCEIELSVRPPPHPQTCKGFNDHEAGKHSKWQALN